MESIFRHILRAATLGLALTAAVSCIEKGDYTGVKEHTGANSANVSGGGFFKSRRTVLIYIAAENSLSPYAAENKENLLKGYAPYESDKRNTLLLYYDIKNEPPVLERITTAKDGTVKEEVLTTYPDTLNSASAATVSRVLNEAVKRFPANSNGLILWSHGNGWLPEGYYYDPSDFSAAAVDIEKGEANAKPSAMPGAEHFPPLAEDPYRLMVKSFGEQNRKEINIQDLAAALPRKYDYIIFDACLMGGIETAYELKDKCDYLALSPAEVLGDGMILYDSAIKYLFDDSFTTPAALARILKEGFDHYDSQTGVNRSATVSLVDCGKLPALASSCAAVFSACRTALDAGLPQDGIQGYFRFNRHWFYDLGDFIETLAAASPQTVSAAELDAFKKALSSAVIYKAATPSFLNFDIDTYSGLASYIYEPSSTYLNAFYKTLAWNAAAGMVP